MSHQLCEMWASVANAWLYRVCFRDAGGCMACMIVCKVVRHTCVCARGRLACMCHCALAVQGPPQGLPVLLLGGAVVGFQAGSMLDPASMHIPSYVLHSGRHGPS
jgi:hypothetical protein